MLSIIAVSSMLLTSISYADDKQAVGHDKEHQHVKGVGINHPHDEAHHKEHDHKAHHPQHDDRSRHGHDKEHVHVQAGVDHAHDEAHHKTHDHKAHHPEHKDSDTKKK